MIAADSNVITSAPDVIGSGRKIARDGHSIYAFSGLVEDRSAGYHIELWRMKRCKAPGTSRFISIIFWN